VSAREAQAAIMADSEPLRKGLERVQDKLGSETGFGGLTLVLLLLSALALLGGAGLLRLYVRDQASAPRAPSSSGLEAERQEQEAKRVNDANQAAILRLMNELQTVRKAT
jgi:twitching motility protein PilJ